MWPPLKGLWPIDWEPLIWTICFSVGLQPENIMAWNTELGTPLSKTFGSSQSNYDQNSRRLSKCLHVSLASLASHAKSQRGLFYMDIDLPFTTASFWWLNDLTRALLYSPIWQYCNTRMYGRHKHSVQTSVYGDPQFPGCWSSSCLATFQQSFSNCLLSLLSG